jgi:hypothetical protein
LSVSRYEIVNMQVAEVEKIMQDSRFGMHDQAYRDFLREIKSLVWEQEARIDGIRTSDTETT